MEIFTIVIVHQKRESALKQELVKYNRLDSELLLRGTVLDVHEAHALSASCVS